MIVVFSKYSIALMPCKHLCGFSEKQLKALSLCSQIISTAGYSSRFFLVHPMKRKKEKTAIHATGGVKWPRCEEKRLGE